MPYCMLCEFGRRQSRKIEHREERTCCDAYAAAGRLVEFVVSAVLLCNLSHFRCGLDGNNPRRTRPRCKH